MPFLWSHLPSIYPTFTMHIYHTTGSVMALGILWKLPISFLHPMRCRENLPAVRMNLGFKTICCPAFSPNLCHQNFTTQRSQKKTPRVKENHGPQSATSRFRNTEPYIFSLCFGQISRSFPGFKGCHITSFPVPWNPLKQSLEHQASWWRTERET